MPSSFCKKSILILVGFILIPIHNVQFVYKSRHYCTFYCNIILHYCTYCACLWFWYYGGIRWVRVTKAAEDMTLQRLRRGQKSVHLNFVHGSYLRCSSWIWHRFLKFLQITVDYCRCKSKLSRSSSPISINLRRGKSMEKNQESTSGFGITVE